MRVFFYALLDHDTKELVYIGQTISPHERKNNHCGSLAELKWSKAPIHMWCREQARAGKPAEYVELGHIDMDRLPRHIATRCKKAVEKELIKAFADVAIASGRTLYNAHGNPYREHNTCVELVDFELVEVLKRKTASQINASVMAAAVEIAVKDTP